MRSLYVFYFIPYHIQFDWVTGIELQPISVLLCSISPFFCIWTCFLCFLHFLCLLLSLSLSASDPHPLNVFRLLTCFCITNLSSWRPFQHLLRRAVLIPLPSHLCPQFFYGFYIFLCLLLFSSLSLCLRLWPTPSSHFVQAALLFCMVNRCFCLIICSVSTPCQLIPQFPSILCCHFFFFLPMSFALSLSLRRWSTPS